MKRRITGFLCLLLACCGWQTVHADGFDPTLPPEPMTKYAVTVSADPAAGAASLSGAGKYTEGSAITVSQTANADYQFEYWTLNGAEWSTSASISYTVGDSAAHFVAHYTSTTPQTPEEQQVGIIVSADPAEGGMVSGTGVYTSGSYATISATANSNYGWSFSYWSKDGVYYGSAATFSYQVETTPAEFVAHFTYTEFDPMTPTEPIAKYRVYTSSMPSGAALTSGDGSYNLGSTVNIQATTQSGWQFVHWTLNGHVYSDALSFNYTVGDSVAYFVAVYERLYAVSVQTNPATGAGTVSGTGLFLAGTVVPISVTQQVPYVFDYWTLNGERINNAQSFSYTVGDSAASFVAYMRDTTDNTFVPVTPPEPLVYTRITATAPENYYFVSWNDGNTDNPRMVLLSEAENYTPVFAPIDFAVAVDATICSNEFYMLGEQRLTLSGVYKATLQSSLGSDSVVTLNLTVNPSYLFTTVDTINDGGSVLFGDTLLTTAGIYRRVYTTKDGCDSIYQHQVILISDSAYITTFARPTIGGEVTGSGYYLKGSIATLEAVPFTGWHFVRWQDGSAEATRQVVVTEDMQFVASFEINRYEVLFVDWNGTVLRKDSVAYGSAATAPTGMSRTGYTFTGWDKAFDQITGDLTVTAQYSINTFTIQFVDWDGTILKSETLEYGSTITAPANPTREGYTFTGWDKSFSIAYADLTITARYSMNSYTVQFVDWDGRVLKTQTVAYGGSATAPSNPYRSGYTFTGWSTTYNYITSDLVVTAQYSVITYTVKFVDWDGTVLKIDTVNPGASATAPSNPTREGYTFTGWSRTFSNVTSNITVTARYTINSYTVQFVDWDGRVLKTQTVNYGSSATAPSNPYREGYTFVGWDIAYTNVISDLTVTAVYRSNVLTSVTVNVLVPSDCGMDISNGMWICWTAEDSEETHIEAMTALDGRIFTATFAPNAASYKFYVMNAESWTSGVHRTYDTSYKTQEICCGEVGYSTYSYHSFYTSNDCSLTDHNYTPYNLVATPISGDSVQFTWEMETQGTAFYIYAFSESGDIRYVGYYTYDPAQGNSVMMTTGSPVAETFTKWLLAVEGSHGYMEFDVYGNGFTVAGNDKVPHDLTVTDNHDGTYTFNWECSGAVDHYTIEIENYSSISPIVSQTVSSRTYTATLASGTDYYCTVRSYNADNQMHGSTYIHFDLTQQDPHSIDLHVYIPVNGDFASENGYAIQWHYEGFAPNAVLPLTSEGNNWYHAELTDLTQHYVYISVLNASSADDATISLAYRNTVYESRYLIVNRYENGDRFIDDISSAYYPNDYLPYNLQAEPSPGKASLSFETNESSNYYIQVMDENGNSVWSWWSSYDSNWDNQVDVTLSYDTEKTFTWMIRTADNEGRSNNYYTFVYGGSFTVPPSPYIPQNLQAVYNGNGTCTVSWTPMDNEEIDRYVIRIDGPRGTTGWAYPSREESSVLVTFKEDASGEYTATLWPMDINNNELARAITSFTVPAVPERDITVRILIQPSSNYDTINGVNLLIIEGEWSTVTMIEEGDGWYTHTFTSSSPGVRISIDDYNTYAVVCGDTCLEYTSNLHFVDCNAHIMDYTPYNLHAEPGAGRVTLSWDANDDASSYLIKLYKDGQEWSYEWYDGNLREVVFNTSNNTEETFSWSIRPYGQNGWAGPAVYGDTFTVAPSPYVAKNLNATPNEDGTYTITWSAAETEEANSYAVFIYSSSGNSVDEGHVSDTVYTTVVLPFAGTYTYYVQTYDANGNALGFAYATLEVEPVPEHTITARVLIQPSSGYDTTNGVKFYRFMSADNVQVDYATDEGEGWYSCTWTTTDPGVRIGLRNSYWNAIQIASDTCLEYTTNLHLVDCNAHIMDYTPYNLHAEPGAGTVTLSWEANDLAPRYLVVLYQDGVRWTYRNCYDYETQTTFTLSNTDTMTFTWSVRPYNNGWASAAVYGEEFTVAPSPYIPQNLQTADNGDGTFTITWNPIDLEGVQYAVVVYNSNGNTVSEYWGLHESSYMTNVLPTAGTYNGYLYVYDSIWNELSYTPFILNVAAVEPHDITVRVLIHPDSGFDTTNGVTFNLYDYSTYSYVSYPAVDEGGSWYRYTFTTTDRTIQFKLGSVYVKGITSDTCFQYTRSLSPVACDAVAHDYRIIPESMTVVSVPGRIEFSWDAVDIAERYILTMRDTATNEYILGNYVYGTNCSIGITPQFDSTVVMWSLYPASPIDMYYAPITGTAMLYKSEVELTNLTATTTDSVNYQFSWESNMDSLLYVFTLAYSGTTIVSDTLSEWNYNYTLPYNGLYDWSVHAIDPSDKKILGGWVYGKSIQTTSSIDPIVNLQGSVDGRTITYTWEMNVPQVMIYLYKQTFNGWYQVIDGELSSLTSFVYEADEDGVYRLSIGAYTENASGQYIAIGYWITKDVPVFTGETFTLQVNAAEGGYIVDPNPSGEYAVGFSVEVGAYAYEHYHFVGWSDGNPYNWRYITITGDTTITAIFEKDTYLVTFLNEDGSLIEEGEWEYGSIPSCSITPVKESTDTETYVFAGWSPQIAAVTENATYTAVFTNGGLHTDVEDVQTATDNIQKILRDGRIYILRGDKIYTVTGQELR